MNNIEKIVLPTNGLLDGVPREVTVRGMKGREISTLFSSLNETAIDAVIKDVTEPSVNVDILSDEDKRYILHKTRELTFGPEITQTLRCPGCGAVKDYSVNYNDLEFKLLEEDIINTPIKMPDEKEVWVKIPTKKDWVALDRYKEKRKLPETYAYILLFAVRIKKINDEVVSLGEAITYLEELPGKDMQYLTDKLSFRYGLLTDFETTCKVCGLNFTGGIGINADLFR
jgi:hypothetical protein